MRLTMPEESNRMGLMRLRIDGSWSVKDFRDLLETTEYVYNTLNSTILLGDFVRAESERNERLIEGKQYTEMESYWSSLFWGTGEVYYRTRDSEERRSRIDSWENILVSVIPYTAKLEVGAIRLESPGWICVLGHLNPLKVIADFISKWRTENTKRMKLEMDSNVRKEELALEREKMNRKFAIDVLSHLPKGHGQALRFGEIAERTINPSIAGLDRLLSDPRILDAELVDGKSDGLESSNEPESKKSPTMRKLRYKSS